MLFAFCWVTDFPMFEFSETENRMVSMQSIVFPYHAVKKVGLIEEKFFLKKNILDTLSMSNTKAINENP